MSTDITEQLNQFVQNSNWPNVVTGLGYNLNGEFCLSEYQDLTNRVTQYCMTSLQLPENARQTASTVVQNVLTLRCTIISDEGFAPATQ